MKKKAIGTGILPKSDSFYAFYRPLAIIDKRKDRIGFTNEVRSPLKSKGRYLSIRKIRFHKIDDFISDTEVAENLRIPQDMIGKRYIFYTQNYFMNNYLNLNGVYLPIINESLKRHVKDFRKVKINQRKRGFKRDLEPTIRAYLYHTNGRRSNIHHIIGNKWITIPSREFKGNTKSVGLIEKQFVKVPLVY